MLLFFPVTVIATHIEIYATIFIYGLLIRCMKVKIIVDGRKIFMFMAPLRYHREEWEAGTERKVSVFCIILNEEEKQRKKLTHNLYLVTINIHFSTKHAQLFLCISCLCVCVYFDDFSPSFYVSKRLVTMEIFGVRFSTEFEDCQRIYMEYFLFFLCDNFYTSGNTLMRIISWWYQVDLDVFSK